MHRAPANDKKELFSNPYIQEISLNANAAEPSSSGIAATAAAAGAANPFS